MSRFSAAVSHLISLPVLAVLAGSLLGSAPLQATEEHHAALRTAAFWMVRDIRDSFELPPEEELCTNDMCRVCHVAEPPSLNNFGAPFLGRLIGAGWMHKEAAERDTEEQRDMMLAAMENLADSEMNEQYYDPETEVVDFDEDGVDDFLEIITGFSPNPGDETDYCDRIPLDYGCGASVAKAPPVPASSPWQPLAAAGVVGLGLAWNLWRRRRQG